MNIKYCDICREEVKGFMYWGDTIKIEIGSKSMSVEVCRKHKKQFIDMVEAWKKEKFHDLLDSSPGAIPFRLTHKEDKQN